MSNSINYQVKRAENSDSNLGEGHGGRDSDNSTDQEAPEEEEEEVESLGSAPLYVQVLDKRPGLVDEPQVLPAPEDQKGEGQRG